MEAWVPIIIALLTGGFLTRVFDYLMNGRVDKITKIQQVYEKSLDDVDERHEKENARRDKYIHELEAEIQTKKALLEQARQTQGELLVKIEDMQTKLNKVGEDVNKITDDFGKFPLVNDRQKEPFGRRATDKPSE